jgi:hypothetical protein
MMPFNGAPPPPPPSAPLPPFPPLPSQFSPSFPSRIPNPLVLPIEMAYLPMTPPVDFQNAGECAFAQSRMDEDFDHEKTFHENDIRDAANLLFPEKMAIAHLNASGIFFVLPKKLETGHAVRCLKGLVKTFESIWDSNELRELIGNESFSFLMNFQAAEVEGTLGMLLPVFSYAKSRASKDILYPRPYITDYLERKVPTFFRGAPRKPNAVFRGALTNPIRLKLIDFGQQNGDVVDVGLHSIVKNTTLATLAKDIKLVRWMDMNMQTRIYRYIINIDGWGCADRLPYLLRLNSVVLYHGASHTNSGECVEWYHQGLQTGDNFIKFDPDLSDLRDRILWLRDHDDVASAIVARANTFSKNLITLKCVNWYMWEVLKRYRSIYRPSGSRTDGEQWLEGESHFDRVYPLKNLLELYYK